MGSGSVLDSKKIQTNMYLVLYPILAVSGNETKITTELSVPRGKKLVEIFLSMSASCGIHTAVAVIPKNSDI